MSNDKDLLKQLQNLPDEAQAPDRWQAIQQQIEADQATESSHQRWWPMAIAACALLVAVITPMFIGENTSVAPQVATSEKQPNKTYQLTIESLQQANAAYYAKLGQKVATETVQLAPETWESLSSLRQAQQQYRQALSEKPQNPRMQERLFWLYQKERKLLRQLVV